MLITSYITITTIQVITFIEIAQYTNMTIVEHLLYSETVLHINEKLTKDYTFNY